jgi:transcriptional regulator with XRE-family HTH domain
MPSRKDKEIRMSTYTGRFAERLRTLRERAGLSIEEMVDLTGIPAQTLYNWERAKNTPPMETYPLLAETLGVKIRTLLPED